MKWPPPRRNVGLVVCGGVSLLIYLALLPLSQQFSHDVAQSDRPLFLTLGLFASAFVIYLVALRCAIFSDISHTRSIVGFAIAFRLTLLFSEPIQEVDIYRYVWDGVVSTQNVSPFEYAPQTIAESFASADLPDDLSRLVRVRDESPGVEEVLSRVHFAGLPTVYPPVSQFVFAVVAKVTPAGASVGTRVTLMKFFLLLFDVATIFIILATLRRTSLHVGWSLAYAWCPLVMKEFANSGHLDAIAVFLSAAAVYCAVVGLYPRSSKTTGMSWLVGGATLLGLAVGAKLYPVALVPILAWSSAKKIGWAKTVGVAIVFVATSLTCLFPMFRSTTTQAVPLGIEATDNGTPADPFLPEPHDPQAGIKAFLSTWMMNDLIFLSIAENVVADSVRGEAATPWFVIVPNTVRESFTRLVASVFKIEKQRVAFVVARTITALVFFGLAILFAVRAATAKTAEGWLEYVFLSMAWFWLLLPTLNPWYWVWALPWIAFARNRIWLVLSGLLFVYYLRFFFEVTPDLTFGGQQGVEVFDFVIVWFEYVPWFAALIGWQICFARKNQKTRPMVS